MKTVKGKNGREARTDNITYTRRLVVAATVEPDFFCKEICDAYGVMDPLLVPGKMLLPGEYQRLADAILELSGFDDTDAVREEVKN